MEKEVRRSRGLLFLSESVMDGEADLTEIL